MALNISSNIVASEKGRELVQHGSALFPIACYAEDLSSYSVAWHWHEEFEYVLCMKGPLHVDVNKTRLTLQTGQGVFISFDNDFVQVVCHGFFSTGRQNKTSAGNGAENSRC